MKTGFIGCGNMGAAIASALCQDSRYEVSVYSTGKGASEFVKTHNNAFLRTSLEQLVENSDVIILAVKPQVLPSLYQSLRPYGEAKKWISLAAGVSLKTLSEQLRSANIVRFMPNVAAKIKSSVTAVAAGEKADKDFAEQAFEIASSFGSAFFLEEKLFSSFIGLSASAIAYIFQFIHALGLGGCKEGIAYAKAVEMACDTMKGAVDLIQKTGRNPVDLEASVCSAGGTTVEGVKVLEEAGFNGTVMDAVFAAAKKAREMENGK